MILKMKMSVGFDLGYRHFFFGLLISLLCSSLPAHAQSDELLSVTVEETSKAATPDDAAKEMTVKAVAQAAREQVTDMIGEAKYQKNQKVIEAKIIKESSKFIPFIDPGQPVQTNEGFKMSVDMKVSEGSLRKMILAAGLLADSEAPGNILSLVIFTDKAAEQTYRWWSPDLGNDHTKFLAQLNNEWSKVISAELAKRGFKLAQPRAAARSADENALAVATRAQMVMRGEVRIRASTDTAPATLAMKVSVYQAAGAQSNGGQSNNGRLITDSVRTLQFEKAGETVLKAKAIAMFEDIAKDIVAEVTDAWQKGIIGASTIKLSVRGALTPKQLVDFKAQLLKSVRDIKNLKERRFEAKQVTFEADFTGDSAQLEEKLKQIQLPDFLAQVGEHDGLLTLDVRPRR